MGWTSEDFAIRHLEGSQEELTVTVLPHLDLFVVVSADIDRVWLFGPGSVDAREDVFATGVVVYFGAIVLTVDKHAPDIGEL